MAMPYISNKINPTISTKNMPSEMSPVERVCHVLTTCGMNASVVQAAASILAS
jgi:hypothetical protein